MKRISANEAALRTRQALNVGAELEQIYDAIRRAASDPKGETSIDYQYAADLTGEQRLRIEEILRDEGEFEVAHNATTGLFNISWKAAFDAK